MLQRRRRQRRRGTIGRTSCICKRRGFKTEKKRGGGRGGGSCECEVGARWTRGERDAGWKGEGNRLVNAKQKARIWCACEKTSAEHEFQKHRQTATNCTRQHDVRWLGGSSSGWGAAALAGVQQLWLGCSSSGWGAVALAGVQQLWLGGCSGWAGLRLIERDEHAG